MRPEIEALMRLCDRSAAAECAAETAYEVGASEMRRRSADECAKAARDAVLAGMLELSDTIDGVVR